MPKSERPTLPKTVVDSLPLALQMLQNIEQLSATIDDLTAQADQRKNTDAITMARVFVVLHRLNDKMEALHRGSDTLGKWGKLFDHYKKVVIPETLEAAGVPHVALAEGFRVGISAQKFVSIPKDQRDHAYQWLRENGLGDLITSTVNSSTLSAAIRKLEEDENQTPPEELFSVADIATTSVTATK